MITNVLSPFYGSQCIYHHCMLVERCVLTEIKIVIIKDYYYYYRSPTGV